jgi:FAD dependent oxidoreductase
MEEIRTDVLVVGGGTGGVAAAIQAARRGAKTVLVSEFGWLGGMLTTAGVVAPDGMELLALQTGIWGAFLQELTRRQPGGLDHAWVSFFTYEPRIGAQIFADWVKALPNLQWIQAGAPREVEQQQGRLTAVRFDEHCVQAQITVDATELGDLLALAEVPFRWGWEWQSGWQEPSAPIHPSTMTQLYSVQAPTWVFVLQDFGADAPEIPVPGGWSGAAFEDTWRGYGPEQFLSYGQLPGRRFMINWPQQGNDYGLQADRLIGTAADRQTFLQDAFDHAQGYAAFLQQQLGRRYGLATNVFPASTGLGGGAYALHPYYRESRRLRGLVAVKEQNILPMSGGQVAALPVAQTGEVSAIAIGNYANDHHYPGFQLPLHPKSMRWGGRWTGTPFALPYGCLVPERMEGLLVAEKNISVSHIANGATRLQPTVLSIGQAAGMAAALCIEHSCQPQELPVRQLQEALLADPTAPMAVVPLLNLPPNHPDWLTWQRYYLEHPEAYPANGNAPCQSVQCSKSNAPLYSGIFQRRAEQQYEFQVLTPDDLTGKTLQLVTLDAEIDRQLHSLKSGQQIQVQGRWNRAGGWLLTEALAEIVAGSESAGQ